MDRYGHPALGSLPGLLLLVPDLGCFPEVEVLPLKAQAVAHAGPSIVAEEDQGPPFLVRAGLEDEGDLLVREGELGAALALRHLDGGNRVDGAYALLVRPLEHHPEDDDTLADRRRRGALVHAGLDERLDVRGAHPVHGLVGLRPHVLQEEVGRLAIGRDRGGLLVDGLRLEELRQELAQGVEAQLAPGGEPVELGRILDHDAGDESRVDLRRAGVPVELLHDLLGQALVGRPGAPLEPFPIGSAEPRQPVFRTANLSEYRGHGYGAKRL